MTVAPGELGSEQIIPAIEQNIRWRAERFVEIVGRSPRLSILSANPEHAPSATYMGLKQKVGEALGIHVQTATLDTAEQLRQRAYLDSGFDGIDGVMVQLPLKDSDTRRTNGVLGMIDLEKDVDGLAPFSPHRPATVRAIEEWMSFQGVEFMEEPVAILGLGRLVGRPLQERLRDLRAQSVDGFDKSSEPLDIVQGLHDAEIIVSATGHPGLLSPELFLPITRQKVLIDVGTAEMRGAQQGDVSDELRDYALENGWTLTPKRGGIGPLTVRALLLNLMDAAEHRAGIDEPINKYRLSLSLAATSANRPAELFREEDDRAYAPTELS